MRRGTKAPALPCEGCNRRTWSPTGWCAECRKRGQPDALKGGRWALDRRRRIYVWLPDPVVMMPAEWAVIERGEAS